MGRRRIEESVKQPRAMKPVGRATGEVVEVEVVVVEEEVAGRVMVDSVVEGAEVVVADVVEEMMMAAGDVVVGATLDVVLDAALEFTVDAPLEVGLEALEVTIAELDAEVVTWVVVPAALVVLDVVVSEVLAVVDKSGAVMDDDELTAALVLGVLLLSAVELVEGASTTGVTGTLEVGVIDVLLAAVEEMIEDAVSLDVSVAELGAAVVVAIDVKDDTTVELEVLVGAAGDVVVGEKIDGDVVVVCRAVVDALLGT